MPDMILQPGLGIYQRPDAARLLGIAPNRLQRWLEGYTFWLQNETRSPVKRRSSPLIATDLPKIDGAFAISFLELMELRVIKAVLDNGFSLQYVRKAAASAAEEFGTRHPFASRRVFVDRQAIYSSASNDGDVDDLVKWEGGRIHQLIAGTIVEQFLQEIEFDPGSSLAFRWWPKGRSVPVVLDPKISFGAPTVEGTGVRTAVLARMASRVGKVAVAEAFHVEVVKAEAAIAFEAELAAA